jgi:hypothetical protein
MLGSQHRDAHTTIHRDGYFVSIGLGDGALLPLPLPPRYALLNTKMPFFSCATSLINAVNLAFCSSERRYGVKWEIQSRVLALGVLRSHSMTMLSSSSIGWPSGPSIAAVALRFLDFGCPPTADAAGDGADITSSASSAFRLLPSFAGGTLDGGRGERVEGPGLPPSPGSVSAPFGGLAATRASGLLGRRPFCVTRGLGAFGLVARFATTECPPCGGIGEVARELGVDGPAGRDGGVGVAGAVVASLAVARDGVNCCMTAGPSAIIGSSSSSSSYETRQEIVQRQ